MKLYVGNLPFQAAESDLRDWFSQAGITVDSVTLVRDRFTGKPRGFGFVEIPNNDDAELAIRNCNGKQLMGRALVVNEARPQTQQGDGGERPPGGGGQRRTSRW